MTTYNIEEIAARYKEEDGRMYAGAYEWMIAELLKGRTVASASSKVLRDKTNSKPAKTKDGSALTQPLQTYKLRRP